MARRTARVLNDARGGDLGLDGRVASPAGSGGTRNSVLLVAGRAARGAVRSGALVHLGKLGSMATATGSELLLVPMRIVAGRTRRMAVPLGAQLVAIRTDRGRLSGLVRLVATTAIAVFLSSPGGQGLGWLLVTDSACLESAHELMRLVAVRAACMLLGDRDQWFGRLLVAGGATAGELGPQTVHGMAGRAVEPLGLRTLVALVQDLSMTAHTIDAPGGSFGG